MNEAVLSTRPPRDVLLLDRATIVKHLTLDDCIVAVEGAFAAHAFGKALTPGLLHVDADGGEFHVKVGGIRGSHTYFACKVNGGFFGNHVSNGYPNIIGLIMLCDGSTGVPLALMESGLITRLRTGAATAVAAKYLAREDSHTVTVCGAGAQAEVQLRALARVLPIRRAYIWGRHGAPELAARMSRELAVDVRAWAELERATRDSDVIVTCTPAKRWYLGREHVVPGTFVAAVGADSHDKQELQPALMAASSVVPDLLDQALQAGDLHHAVATGMMKPSHVRGELGAVIIGRAPRRISRDEVIVFDSTGTALQDASTAAVVYQRALSNGDGTFFGFWTSTSVV